MLTVLEGLLLEGLEVVEGALLLLLPAEDALHLGHDSPVGGHHQVVVGQGLKDFIR